MKKIKSLKFQLFLEHYSFEIFYIKVIESRGFWVSRIPATENNNNKKPN